MPLMSDVVVMLLIPIVVLTANGNFLNFITITFIERCEF